MTRYQKLKINLIVPNPDQPRNNFSGIEELAGSIKDKGLIEPITVRPTGDRYQVVIGERRYRAARLAGLAEIEVQVRDVSDQEAYELALVENIQRQDLTPMEEAEAFKRLQEQGATQEQIGKMIGKGQSYVAHKLRLLKLPNFLTFYLQEGLLTENHIRQVAKLKDIYPPGLMRTLSEEFDTAAVWDEDAASFFLCQMRPEERVIYLKASTAHIEACKLFAEYVSKHTAATIPQWEVAAFWWASIASQIPLNVAELTTAIDRWRERYEDAMRMWQTVYFREPGSTVPKRPKEYEKAKIYWGFWGDLRHSGSLSVKLKESEGGTRWWFRLLKKTVLKGSYCLPSHQTI